MIENQKASDSDLICLAEITSPHGIRGAVKLKTHTQLPTDILQYKNLVDQTGTPYKLHHLSTPSPSSLVVSISGITNRNHAEKLRGIKLYISRSDLPHLSEDEFYHTDLIGMKVINLTGDLVGKVLFINNHGAGDFLDIQMLTNEILSIPFRKEAVPQVNVGDKVITIDAAYLLSSKA